MFSTTLINEHIEMISNPKKGSWGKYNSEKPVKAPNINIEIFETNPSHLIIANGLEDVVFSK